MVYREDLSQILESVVTAMTFPMRIMGVVVNGDLTISIEVCDMRHAEPGRTVTIGGNDYTILTIDDQNNIIQLSAGPAITATTFNLYGVHFFEGTPIDLEKQVKDIPNATDKTPMVVLLIPYSELIFEDPEEAKERESTFTMFFLTQANFDKWSTGDLMDNAVRPMGRLQQHFMKDALADSRFNPDGVQDKVTPRLKFGVYVNNKGVQKGFQSMDLSGVQQDTTMELWKNCNPFDNCPE